MNYRLSHLRKKHDERFGPLDPARAVPEGLTWHVIVTKRGREYKAAHWLEREAAAFTLVPLVTVFPRPKKGGKNHVKPQPMQWPLLPRLVFAGFAVQADWFKIEACLDYADRLEVDGAPAVLQAREIIRLRDNSEAARRKAPTSLKAGSQARFVDSRAFGHATVQIERMEGKYAVLKQMLLGTEIRVELDRLEAA